MLLTDSVMSTGFLYLALPLAGAICLGPIACRFGTHFALTAHIGAYMALAAMYAAIYLYRTQQAMAPNSVFRFPEVLSIVADLLMRRFSGFDD